MWATFLKSFNGIPLKVWRDCDWDVQLFSDAAGSTGFGLYWDGRWCAEEWPNDWKNGGHSIAFLEPFRLIVAVCLWGAELRHSRMLFRVDNMAVVQLVNRQSAREAGVLQLMRVFKSEAESGRQHGAEARSIPGWLATDPFSGVAGLLNRWAAPVVWEALDEKVTPHLVEDAVESVKLRGTKLERKAAGQVGWLFLSALRTVYRKTLTQDAEIMKLRD
ncbi:hypothetical protein NDU88_001427 [Pleurodeles waltl]|uniref:Uncharacterized protein n=1 Tax=Pleurodeles waltl TaxID=8319 RepID=A0AAV7SCX2_PLEWA|nr:hypothetical protein NDU88_001427 [Pleurodeles waltl]